ncbi:hypothetical protein GCL60_16835 (plasmid) [Silvanigrella paludirubra]|uniref:Thioesterase n=1 Tax=Silvanigrella paludirubra TaxID=2499159 RepID=A0A6N6VP05_9BACT|nr:thioesterase family protein [Silvanigrella paludirubra]KAB8035613.1 hypothetical protein GCL60_16835 [Silvanigrella paludirubra]MBX9837478.1 acyl-CoA thioesterase [Silvanigrellaceae bacterium]
MSKNKIEIGNQKSLFLYETKVRVGDLNYANHLGHDNLIKIIHDVRMSFLEKYGLGEINLDINIGLIIANLNINYLSQSFLNDFLRINVYPGEIYNSSFEILYKIENQNEIISICSTTMVCCDIIKKRPVRIPEKFLKILKYENII